jgi:FkbM family methyltransferase
MTYYSLCGSIALSNIKNAICLNFGLGTQDQVGKQKLNIISLDGGGSTLHPNNNVLQTEEIEIRTLDSFNIDNISFIKIDVENNELQVLMSSEDTLKRSNYPKILFEINENNIQLINFLEKINYNIIPVNGCANMFLAVNKSNT